MTALLFFTGDVLVAWVVGACVGIVVVGRRLRRLDARTPVEVLVSPSEVAAGIARLESLANHPSNRGPS